MVIRVLAIIIFHNFIEVTLGETGFSVVSTWSRVDEAVVRILACVSLPRRHLETCFRSPWMRTLPFSWNAAGVWDRFPHEPGKPVQAKGPGGQVARFQHGGCPPSGAGRRPAWNERASVFVFAKCLSGTWRWTAEMGTVPALKKPTACRRTQVSPQISDRLVSNVQQQENAWDDDCPATVPSPQSIQNNIEWQLSSKNESQKKVTQEELTKTIYGTFSCSFTALVCFQDRTPNSILVMLRTKHP